MDDRYEEQLILKSALCSNCIHCGNAFNIPVAKLDFYWCELYKVFYRDEHAKRCINFCNRNGGNNE